MTVCAYRLHVGSNRQDTPSVGKRAESVRWYQVMLVRAQRTPTCCVGGRRASTTPKMTVRSRVTTHVRCEVAHRTRPNLAVAWATRDGRSRCTCPVFLEFVCVLAEIRNQEALAL